MPNATFRIESVSIEGFKAFSTQQTFHFEGRTVFLFGPNGFGKTSVVEAIRWCLFGLGSRGGGIVKNQFYQGPCIVQMTLRASDGLWTMQRRLRPTSNEPGRSVETIRDPSGKERNLEDVLPQLSRIGHRDGAHVIYAAQQPSNRRPEANITDFSYVVYRYLGLEEVPRLSDVLNELSKAWTTQEKEIGESVEKLGDSFSKRIAEVDESLTRITSAPPWGTALTPTNADTREKIDLLAGDAENLGAQCSKDAFSNFPLRQKLYEIDTAVQAFLSGELEGVSQGLTERSNQLKNAQSLLEKSESTAHQITTQSQTAETLKQEFEAVLNGSSIGELKNTLQRLEGDLETAQLKLAVVRSSLSYLEAVGDGSEHEMCPTCDAGFQPGQLKTQLQDLEAKGDYRTKEILGQRDQLRDRISTAKRFRVQLEALETQLVDQRNDLTKTLELAESTFGLPSPPTIEALREHVAEICKGYQELQSAKESQTEASITWKARINNANREVRFHELRSLKERLQRLYNERYEDLHDNLRDLGGLRDIADETRMLLNTQLYQRLQKALPPVAQEMTDVFLRLTGNPTFDSISIQQGENTDGSMTLELRVSSSRGPGSWAVDRGILNGQALNTIHLVPYFVFSRYQDDPLLDLLLLDDPTQAFDTNKIQLLLTELADAASHATLFVATHEEDRFLPAVKEFFGSDNVKAFRAVGISEDGPRFEDVPIDL